MLRVILAVWLAGCAVDAPALPAGHPANPASPSGRLAPPSEAFGSAAGSAQPMPMHMHMHHS